MATKSSNNKKGKFPQVKILNNLPVRNEKSRDNGITVIIDKGLSSREVEDMLEVGSQYIDLVKLGWTTALFTPNLSMKLKIYRKKNIPVFFGGTLFEAFYLRNQMKDFFRLLDQYQMTHVEISDGIMIDFDHNIKCNTIEKISKSRVVLSEVGSKISGVELSPKKWASTIARELEAGSWKVLCESRESGTAGIYDKEGKVDEAIVKEILEKSINENIIWEAPRRDQQVWFIQKCGTNVNLGNIQKDDIIALETLRLGLRADTFNLNNKE